MRGEVITRDSVLRDPARSHDFCGGNLIALAPETVGSRPGEAVGSESEGRWGWNYYERSRLTRDERFFFFNKNGGRERQAERTHRIPWQPTHFWGFCLMVRPSSRVNRTNQHACCYSSAGAESNDRRTSSLFTSESAPWIIHVAAFQLVFCRDFFPFVL